MAVPKNPEPTPVNDGTGNPLLDPLVPGEAIDPAQLASSGPEGAPQPVPREGDPGINANVTS